MPIKAIIFDLFDVLFLAEDFTQRRAYEQRMGLEENGRNEKAATRILPSRPQSSERVSSRSSFC